MPVYIQAGDTPLEEINPDLAEAFHALPSGRSASHLEAIADSEIPEQADQPKLEDIPEIANASVDHTRPYEKYSNEKKTNKKASSDIAKPIERS